MSSVEIDDLLQAGLLEPRSEPHLSSKGRDWLRALEGLQTDDVTQAGSSDEDFVQSTSALFR
ncbi:MAG: hypothetical protein ACRDJV_03425 [Actinomycetota bacterium]